MEAAMKVPIPGHGSMIKHEYECSVHGRFDSGVPFGANVPKTKLCPVMVPHGKPSNDVGQTTMMCREVSPWRPGVVAALWKCPK